MSIFRFYYRYLCLFILTFNFTYSGSFILVPQTHIEIYGEEVESGDRRFVIEGVTSLQRRQKDLSTTIPCIRSFLRRYISKPGWTSFMVLDSQEDIHEFAQSLVISLDFHFAFIKHTADLDFDASPPASSTVILMSNASNLEDTCYILSPCDRGCPFVTLLVTTFEDEESFLQQAETVIQLMWMRRISAVVVLGIVRDSVLAAGSLTFESNLICVPSSPIILDKCEGDSWKKLRKIKTPKLNKCILKVAYFAKPPYVIASNDSEDLQGFEGSLTEEVLKGQRIDRRQVEWNDNTSYAEQTQILLYNDEMADLVIGGMLRQSDEDIDYSTTYDMLKVVWVIPKVPNVSLKGLVQPFQPYVWAAIGGALILGALIRNFLSRDISCLDMFALIIGVSTARRPRKLSSMIQFAAWSIFSLFLTEVYVDSLADQLINLSDLKIETMKELMSSSFKIGGTAAFANLIEMFEPTDEIVSQIRERFVTFDQNSYTKQFNDLLEGRNNSFALVTVLNFSRSDAIETVYAYTMTKEVICSFPLALATWKGFPYLSHINTQILQFVDFGILDFMFRLAMAKEAHSMLSAMEEDQEYKMELHLQQFIPAFLLMIIGFSSGFVSFILEIVFFKR